jgi:hypothetical protein
VIDGYHITLASAPPDAGRIHANLRTLRRSSGRSLPRSDPRLLAELELAGGFTIRNAFLGDRIVRRMPFEYGLRYATHLAYELQSLFEELGPEAVLGGFDGLHGAIGLGVARRLQLPWYAMSFSTIPPGLACFCDGLSPYYAREFGPNDETRLRETARAALLAFELGELRVPAHISPVAWKSQVLRAPAQLETFSRAIWRSLAGTLDRQTESGPGFLMGEFLRRRWNAACIAARRFETNGESPYMLYALHRQPESSIDVWAPFFANQFAVVEWLARGLPATHRLLVKLHKSDSDNYSPAQLSRFESIPGVRLVAPFVDSRPLVEGASVVAAVHGTIAMEASLLGKPVVLLSRSRLEAMPSVRRLDRVEELPDLIRTQLRRSSPSRDEILSGFMEVLRPYRPACYNDWSREPSEFEVDNLVQLFQSLVRVGLGDRAVNLPSQR